MVARPRRLAPEARREQLVAVALDHFADVSYDQARLEVVAEAADVRRSLLYRYFPAGKSDLFVAVVEEAWKRLVARIDTDPARPLSDKLPANVALFVDLAAQEDPAVKVIERSRHVDEPRIRAITREARRTWARRLALNHLGDADPPQRVVTALAAYVAFAELLLNEWHIHATISRAELETLLAGALPQIVALATEDG